MLLTIEECAALECLERLLQACARDRPADLSIQQVRREFAE